MSSVALVSRSTRARPEELAVVASAINTQVVKDLAPMWNISGTVAYMPSEQSAADYPFKAYIVDDPNRNSGIHVHEASGQVFALIKYEPGLRWSIAASHEILEMLVDPFLNRTYPGASPTNPPVPVHYVVEICDPVQACSYEIDLLHKVLVSDFCLPAYYRTGPPANQFSFRGNVSSPGDVAIGGYVSWITNNREVYQLQRFSGPRQIVGPVPYDTVFGGTMNSTNLRGALDRHGDLSGNKQAIGVHFQNKLSTTKSRRPRTDKKAAHRKFQAYLDHLLT